MEAVIDDRAYVATEDEGTAPVRGAQLPLAMVSEGQTATVLKVRGSQDLRQHLS